MADQTKKRAMKRLAQDLQEIQNEPVANVSAAPLDEDMFEWHCNFRLDDTVYHLILYFPANYPYVSPSAEFVPVGYRFVGGATTTGKKGIKICLSIFSDFATYHTEWANEKSMGWSPGYTVQTVLLNLVSFLAETNHDHITENNSKLAKAFKCKDCGHTHSKPFPPVATEESIAKDKAKKGAQDEKSAEIVDYIFKDRYKMTKPGSEDDLFGYGLIQSGPVHRPALTTPCEFLRAESYFSMKTSVGRVQSVMKEDLAFFLPMFINPKHGSMIQATFERTMNDIAKVLPKCKPGKTPVEEMVIKTLPNLMSATVVEFSKGTQHTSDNHLAGYFALHRLFLWAIQTYPTLQKLVDDRLEVFMADEENRNKKACPHIGEWLMLLAGSSKYRWGDAAGNAYLSESWRRNVMWYVKDNHELGYLDKDKKYRLEKTLNATAVSRKLLAFQVLFLDIALPSHMSRDDIIRRYDDNNGAPTAAMRVEMKAACQRIEDMKTYSDWFKVLRLDVPGEDEIYQRLVDAVEYSINTNGYHWSFWKTGGGWGQVLRKYTGGTPGWAEKRAAQLKAQGKEPEDASTTTKGKGKGKKTAAVEEKKPKAAAKAKTAPKGKGRGKAKVVEEEEEEDDMEVEEPEPKLKGRGRGKRKAEEDADDDTGRKGRGKKIKEEEPAVGKGRGRGKAARGRGRGGRGRK